MELDVFKAQKHRCSFYIPIGYNDQDSGGSLLEKLEKNIAYCANEKWQKIQNVKSRYPVWWLALVDHIGFGLDDFVIELFRERVSIDHEWDKILLIDPRDVSRYLEF